MYLGEPCPVSTTVKKEQEREKDEWNARVSRV